jgi:geranylgeranyl pyrophosphate synthase
LKNVLKDFKNIKTGLLSELEILSIDKILNVEELTAIMEKKSRRVLERFGQVSVSGVNHPQLLSILADVKAYWKDNFRPPLTSFSCEAVGGQPEVTEDASLMISLLGAGLGIHDDIIDKSLYKHGRNTILGLYGIEDALLVGELFIVKALTMIRETVRKNYCREKILNIVEEFESFFLEVWEGEFMETQCRRNLNQELEHYQKILWMSTADTEACSRFGAVLGGGSEMEVEALAEVGRRIGFMHRLTEDIKDTLNSVYLPCRLKNESIPLPILYAAKSSKSNEIKIKSILEQSSITLKDVLIIWEFCLKSDTFNYVLRLAKENEMKAIRKLNLLKKSEARCVLTSMVINKFDVIDKLCKGACICSTKSD